MHQSWSLPLQTGMVSHWWQWGPYMKRKRGVEKITFTTITSTCDIINQTYNSSCNTIEWARTFSISPFLEMHTWSIIGTFLTHSKAVSPACNNDTVPLVAIVKTAEKSYYFLHSARLFALRHDYFTIFTGLISQ